MLFLFYVCMLVIYLEYNTEAEGEKLLLLELVIGAEGKILS